MPLLFLRHLHNLHLLMLTSTKVLSTWELVMCLATVATLGLSASQSLVYLFILIMFQSTDGDLRHREQWPVQGYTESLWWKKHNSKAFKSKASSEHYTILPCYLKCMVDWLWNIVHFIWSSTLQREAI